MISVKRLREVRASTALFKDAREKERDPIDNTLLLMGRCELVAAVSPEILEQLKEEYERGGWCVTVARGKIVISPAEEGC